jgi:hypothetical protein
MMGIQLADVKTVPMVPFYHYCESEVCNCWPTNEKREGIEGLLDVRDHSYRHPVNSNNRAYRRMIRALHRRQIRRTMRAMRRDNDNRND